MGGALSATQTARAGGALLLANARYWSSVAPLVRAQIVRWEERARAIPDPALQALALGKLSEERFNVELAATLATLAPRARRAAVADAIVALQIAYDYLDATGERPGGERAPEDGGYARELIDTVKQTLSRLPAHGAVSETMRSGAERCKRAQALVHAAAHNDDRELQRWATREAAGSELGWPEYLAGASASVLALHALIAAAADPRTTTAQARAIDAAYLRIAALTMLDSLIDSEQDAASGQPGYARHYDNPDQLATRLGEVAHDALKQTCGLPHAGHHAMTLAGVVAFYASAPAASSPLARPVIARLRGELRPLIGPTLLVMRVWRVSKLLRRPRWVVSSR